MLFDAVDFNVFTVPGNFVLASKLTFLCRNLGRTPISKHNATLWLVGCLVVFQVCQSAKSLLVKNTFTYNI